MKKIVKVLGWLQAGLSDLAKFKKENGKYGRFTAAKDVPGAFPTSLITIQDLKNHFTFGLLSDFSP